MSKIRKTGTALIAFLSIAAALAAAIVAMMPLLAALVPQAYFPGLYETSGWLLAENRVVFISGSLAFVAFVLLWLARTLVKRSTAVWSGQGCPDCSEKSLVRVHRQSRERFLAYITGMPIGRYACRECFWDGLRLVGGFEPSQTAILPKGTQPSAPLLGFDAGTDSSKLNPPVTAITLKSSVKLADMQGDASFGGKTGTISFSDLAQFPDSLGARFADWLQGFGTRPLPVALFYLVLLTVSEAVAVTAAPVTGAIMHMVALFLLLLHAAFTWSQPIHRFLLALTLVPLIRIISLSLPLVNFPLTYWYFITSVPLFGAAFVVMRELNFSWSDVFGFRWRGLPVQLMIGMTGLLMGTIEFVILRPEPLIQSFSWQAFWLPAIILLISTGFLEEFIFRFLLQRTSIEGLGVALGIAYVGLFFAVLHIGYHSVTDFLFVLVVGLLFGWLAYKTRSIIGVTLAHGLTNIVLFLIMPFVLGNSSQPLGVELGNLCEQVGVPPAICQWIGPEFEENGAYEPIEIEGANENLDRNTDDDTNTSQIQETPMSEQPIEAPKQPVGSGSADKEPSRTGFNPVDYDAGLSDQK
jgi:hypothetical protein